MRHKRFRLINLAWITTLVTGLMLSVASPATADPGQWDPTLPARSVRAPLATRSPSPTRRCRPPPRPPRPRWTWASNSSADSGSTSAASRLPPAPPTPAGRIPRATAGRRSSTSIKRGGSQMGVPYSWGGGSLDGPSKGVGDGANINGFDCSGLMRYAFAGVGVLIPRFSGDQYNAGRHIPPRPGQARRPDLLRPGRQPARHHVPGQRSDAGGIRKRRQSHRQPGAEARHDAVPD